MRIAFGEAVQVEARIGFDQTAPESFVGSPVKTAHAGWRGHLALRERHQPCRQDRRERPRFGDRFPEQNAFLICRLAPAHGATLAASDLGSKT